MYMCVFLSLQNQVKGELVLVCTNHIDLETVG